MKIHMFSGDKRIVAKGQPFMVSVCRRTFDQEFMTDHKLMVTCKQCLVRIEKQERECR